MGDEEGKELGIMNEKVCILTFMTNKIGKNDESTCFFFQINYFIKFLSIFKFKIHNFKIPN
jgi:hypothetical protein